MRAAIDFGLTNTDVVIQREDGTLAQCMVPSAGGVNERQRERALAAAGQRLLDFDHIVVTGGQHRKLPAQIGAVLITGINEVTAIGRGGLFLSGLREAMADWARQRCESLTALLKLSHNA